MVDLAWLRGTPWRERVAATFDPPQWRDELRRIDSVRVRHRPDSGVAGVLFCGWLASRLGWDRGLADAGERPAARQGPRQASGRGTRARAGRRPERARPRRHRDRHGLRDVDLARPRPRGPLARRTDAKGNSSEWTVLGASRGEAGILGEGIRQALLRDHAYEKALGCAEAMLAR